MWKSQLFSNRAARCSHGVQSPCRLQTSRQSGVATTLDANLPADDKRATAKPHLLLASMRGALTDDEAPEIFLRRRPMDLTLLIVRPFCHLSPH
jgi:hypothetical protein